MRKKQESLWLDRALVVSPYYFRLCLTEKDYHKELKSLGIPKKSWGSFAKAGSVETYESKNGVLCAIVMLNRRKCDTKEQVYGLLVHEAVHLFRFIKRELDEHNPSSEFEAYAIQSLSQRLMESYREQTK